MSQAGWQAADDLSAAERLCDGPNRLRSIIAFHCQQAAEKCIKALLIDRQIEFPKTHDIARLLDLVASSDPSLAHTLRDAETLSPFGVEARYPSDAPELLPGAETDAVRIAKRVRLAVLAALGDP